ncbi:hypothetical protein K7X08_036892 [Anisodus acutangulus]|uniref:Uncharacterized protein n=1 Tax=Anisodus acutangulus TaxID=402998 RepID=A0A9Q1L6T7_9SOLA|nr:hypothetical protein K7X08_036892 [Anisodus acutangulus]
MNLKHFGALWSLCKLQGMELKLSALSKLHDYFRLKEFRVYRVASHTIQEASRFEEIIKEKGLIIRGWAPQVLILDHKAIGAFVTHCGWNSTLEGISAGLPMVTWPVFAEQFFNEKLVTEVLRTGVGVGSVKWQKTCSEGVKKEAIAKAIKRVMMGEEAEGFRSRAIAYKEMPRQAVEGGGLSYTGLTTLLQEISSYSSTSD